jgi:hypothetical protein
LRSEGRSIDSSREATKYLLAKTAVGTRSLVQNLRGSAMVCMALNTKSNGKSMRYAELKVRSKKTNGCSPISLALD